jgi:N-acyl-D-amino-acid deacylase
MPTRYAGVSPFPALALLGVPLVALGACRPAREVDLVLRNAVVYDGSGAPPRRGGVAVEGDAIVAVGDVAGLRGRREIDAGGLALAPGFINVLSWATESLLADGRSLSDIRQGVTLEVFGEGWSMGPLNEAMKREMAARQADIRFEVAWTTLGEYLDHLVARGISPNVASFVGATTVRIHELGYENRPPTPAELARMQALVERAMEEGALGVGSSLIYPPAFFAGTDELVALSQAAARAGGTYISHLRSEGGRLLEALDELIEVSRRAGIAAEVYHLKAAGRGNWGKLGEAIARIEGARAAGLPITANMYTYTAGATSLAACLPPWAQEGGHEAFLGRLGDPAARRRLAREMATPSEDWENLFLAAGPEQILLVGFKTEALKPLTGKSLAEVAALREAPVEQTVMDLLLEDDGDVGAVYFLMSEDNVRREIALPWVSFGSDAASMAPEGVFLKASTHPRAYGNFARLLGRYVREEKLISLEEAIRRLTALPAANLHLERRGRLAPGHFADLVVFDPATIADHATFEKPHQLATGAVHVFVNGVQVLAHGEHTGATPGRVVRGPGWKEGDLSARTQGGPVGP